MLAPSEDLDAVAVDVLPSDCTASLPRKRGGPPALRHVPFTTLPRCFNMAGQCRT